jgi:signal transduction histidine kinase
MFALAANRWMVPYLCSSALALLLAVVVNARGRGPARPRLAGLLLTMSLVFFASGAAFASGNLWTATWAERCVQAVVSWLPVVGVRFASALTGRRNPWLERLTLAAAPLTGLLCVATPWVVAGARPYRYGFTGVAGPLYPLANAQLLLIAVVPLQLFRRIEREHRALELRQLKNVLFCFAVGMLALSDTLALVGIDVPPLGWLPLLVAANGLVLAILRQRFLDIRMAVRRSLWWLLSTLAGTALFTLLLLPLANEPSSRQLWIAVLAMVMVGQRLWMATAQARLDRLVGRRRRDLDAEMTQLSAAAATLQTTEQLGRSVDRFLLALDRRLAALVVMEPARPPRVALSAWGSVPAPSLKSPLTAELKQLRTLISRDDVRGTTHIEIERACVRWGAEYLGPLIDGDELYGIVAISPKTGGGMADVLELETLERMCVTVTAALASARLYERLRALSDELEEKAESRSVSLAKALRDLRGAEQRLVQSEKLAALGQIVGGVAADLGDEVREVHARVAELRWNAETLADAANEVVAAHPELVDQRVAEMTRDVSPLLDAVSEGARRALAIAHDLSRFASSSGPSVPPERTPQRLDELMDGTLKLCSAHLHAIAVVRHYDRGLPLVPVESGPLGQVMLNLVLNAVQAMRGAGTLTLSTSRVALDGQPGGGVELAVTDSGPGIPPDVLPRIFEPFFSTKSSTHGTGLGLSVSYGIVDRHGGRIAVESESGRGTTFRVQLPVR